MPAHLINHVKKFVHLKAEEEKKLAEYFTQIEVPKNEYLLRAGDICRANYFVVNG